MSAAEAYRKMLAGTTTGDAPVASHTPPVTQLRDNAEDDTKTAGILSVEDVVKYLAGDKEMVEDDNRGKSMDNPGGGEERQSDDTPATSVTEKNNESTTATTTATATMPPVATLSAADAYRRLLLEDAPSNKTKDNSSGSSSSSTSGKSAVKEQETQVQEKQERASQLASNVNQVCICPRFCPFIVKVKFSSSLMRNTLLLLQCTEQTTLARTQDETRTNGK